MKLIGMDDLIGLCDVNYVINLDCFILFSKLSVYLFLFVSYVFYLFMIIVLYTRRN